jgi:hypothetical protein
MGDSCRSRSVDLYSENTRFESQLLTPSSLTPFCLCQYLQGNAKVFLQSYNSILPNRFQFILSFILYKIWTPWPESASEFYQPIDGRLSSKLVPTFTDIGCNVVSVTDPYDCNLDFQDRSRYFFYEVAPQLYSRGWVNSVPDPLLLRKCGSAGNRNPDLWICSQELWPLDHRGGLLSSTKRI